MGVKAAAGGAFISGERMAPDIHRRRLESVRGVMGAGATGVAVGRNVRQIAEPLKMANTLHKTVFD